MLGCCLCSVALQLPSTPCFFSCKELQDIDLELNVDSSAFYDQFVIAQVGGAAGGGAARERVQVGREATLLGRGSLHSPPLTPDPGEETD